MMILSNQHERDRFTESLQRLTTEVERLERLYVLRTGRALFRPPERPQRLSPTPEPRQETA